MSYLATIKTHILHSENIDTISWSISTNVDDSETKLRHLTLPLDIIYLGNRKTVLSLQSIKHTKYNQYISYAACNAQTYWILYQPSNKSMVESFKEFDHIGFELSSNLDKYLLGNHTKTTTNAPPGPHVYTIPSGIYQLPVQMDLPIDHSAGLYDDIHWLSHEGVGTEFSQQEPKCDCGISKTMGPNTDLQFHSTWCTLRKNK